MEQNAGDFAAEQREVQRLLGRCLIRIQQYERLLKTLLGLCEISGDVETTPALLAQRTERLRRTTLGNLVQELFGTFLESDDASSARDGHVSEAVDKVTIRTRTTLQMSAERLQHTRGAITDLVTMRNDLVHHLIESHDLWTHSGCDAAKAHLVSCCTKIDEHYEELRGWAEAADNTRATMVSFLQTPAYEDFLVNGIAPDGTVHWTVAGIVSALREARQAAGSPEWMSLEHAVNWITRHDASQVPSKYGCKSWQQALHLSGAFDLEYRTAEDGRKAAWYRERPVIPRKP